MSVRKFLLAFLMAGILIAVGQNQAIFAEQPAETQFVVTLSPKCFAGPHKQPNGPFAVLVFCEDALGNYIAVYYADAIGAPQSSDYPGWSLSNRVWQDHWGCDVTSFSWSAGGKYLYVATWATYGDGGLFQVDLHNRKSKRIFPAELPEGNLGYGVQITELDVNNSVLAITESILHKDGAKEAIHYLKLEE